MRILFYTSFNSRSRDTESLMEGFIKNGESVFLLTQKEKGEYHSFASSLGVNTFGFKVTRRPVILYIILHWTRFIYFCWKYKIDMVYAHLEEPGLIAVLSQYLIRSKVVVCRHIVDEAYLFKNRNFIWLNKIVYSLAKYVVVVSNRAKTFMIENENINSNKIHSISLGYNFNFYSKPSPEIVNGIKNKYAADILIITACRLVPAKRPTTSILAVKELIEKNINAKLLILGEGPQQEELTQYINNNHLSDSIFVLGFKNNIIDYLAASDVLLHPSILDSSSVIIKEAGLLQKTVITCKNVGDVDDYLIHGENAMLVDKENPLNEMVKHLTNIAQTKNTEEVKVLGQNLCEVVFKRFNITNALISYKKLNKEILTKLT